MGGSPTKTALIEQELQTCQNPHSLVIDDDVKSCSRLKFTSFASKLQLCWTSMGCEDNSQQAQELPELRQYFVTDKRNTIQLTVHGRVEISDMLPANYHVEKVFDNSEDVLDRVTKIGGMTSHSLLLRNSEHFANYIAGRGWISTQSVEGCLLYEHFKVHIQEQHRIRQLINTLPSELRKGRLLYSEERALASFSKCPPAFSHEEKDRSYKFVFFELTGCTKSRLFGLMCSKDVLGQIADTFFCCRPKSKLC